MQVPHQVPIIIGVKMIDVIGTVFNSEMERRMGHVSEELSLTLSRVPVASEYIDLSIGVCKVVSVLHIPSHRSRYSANIDLIREK